MEEEASLRGRVSPDTPAEPVAATPRPVATPVPPRAPAAPRETPPTLFGTSRPTGHMPAGLAAAAKNLSSSETPAGLNALTVAEAAAPDDSGASNS